MANHYGALPIVSKGLVFCVDAKDKDSYPGSGTTWTDVVNSRPGTITNSPTFNSSGYFDLDGSNDRGNELLAQFITRTFSAAEDHDLPSFMKSLGF